MIKVLFENDFALAVLKPAACLSVPSRLGAHEKRPVLTQLLRKQLNTQILPVHRLDFEVSGVILFAKTKEFHRDANSWFEKGSIRKTYWAVTTSLDRAEALPPATDFTWESFLVRGKKRAFEAPYGQKAVTHARIELKPRPWDRFDQIAKLPRRLDWTLKPQTGRSHQLRYELSKRGFPIYGDKLYDSPVELDAIALHAAELDFTACPNQKKYELPSIIGAELNL